MMIMKINRMKMSPIRINWTHFFIGQKQTTIFLYFINYFEERFT